jgi:hypothetical protein
LRNILQQDIRSSGLGKTTSSSIHQASPFMNPTTNENQLTKLKVVAVPSELSLAVTNELRRQQILQKRLESKNREL